MIEQATKYAAEDGFFAKLAAGAKTADGPLPAELQSKLDAGAAAARAAYSELAGFLEAELLPAAPAKDAVGRERYALASRDFLGATVDLEETYAWGVQELDRIIAEQEQGGRANPARRHHRGGQGDPEQRSRPPAQGHRRPARPGCRGSPTSAVADLAGVHFEIPDVMKTLECRIAPTDEGGIYYTGPSDDFSRPGRMWWSVPAGEDTFTTWAETTTVFHEGVPGHHLQVGHRHLPPRTAEQVAPQRLLDLGARRRLGALRREAHAGTGLPQGSGRPHGHAGHAAHAGGPRGVRHRRAPGAGGSRALGIRHLDRRTRASSSSRPTWTSARGS